MININELNNLTTLLIGIIITLICTGIPFYYSTKQLSKEARKLRSLSNLVIRAIEESGIAKFNRDKNGEPIGLIFNMEINESINLSTSIHQNTEKK